MEELMFYLLDGLLVCGEIVPCDGFVAGEEAWRIDVVVGERFVHCWTLLRSDIIKIRYAYEERKEYMCKSDCQRIEKLIAVL